MLARANSIAVKLKDDLRMHSELSQQSTGMTKPAMPMWGHCTISVVLLVVAAVLDVAKPFDKTWSIFYLLPVLYAGWTLRGRLELLLYATVTTSVFLVPTLFRPNMLWAGTGIFNRGFGVLLGMAVIFLLWERRRFASALELANQQLEVRIRERTVALEITNESLRREIAEREKGETEQKRLEEQLRQAHKMEAIGCPAGGIAHDFNNLLTVINGYCSMLLDQVPVTAGWRQSLMEVHKAGARAAEMTRQLLAFSRKQILQLRPIDINRAVASAEGLLRQLLPENVRIRLELNSAVQPILADAGQLVQVLLNLASNSRDAMPGGGEFRICTDPLALTEKRTAGLPDLCPGPYVRLRVCDTGHGMDEATRQHIFEPFFTTKEVGKGTGLGLASVYGIIKQLGGCIEAASEPDGGTTFTIVLPCDATATLPSGETSKPATDVPCGGESILLVEDEDQVRAFAAIVLRNAGYRVWQARNGQEAFTIATDSDAPRLDLLITDAVMPEMGGPTLVKRLAPLQPSLKVLFISGYSKTEAMGVLGRSEFLLEKPFAARELLTLVREILHRAPKGLAGIVE